MRTRFKGKLWWSAPSSDLHVIRRAVSYRYRCVWHIRNRQQEFPLFRVQFRDALVRGPDALRDLLHLRDPRIGILFLFFEPRNFLAGFVALRLQRLGLRDERSPLLIKRPEPIQIQCRSPSLGHAREHIQMISKIIQVMHRLGRIASLSHHPPFLSF